MEIFQYSQEKYFTKTGVITMKKRISQTNIQVKQDMYKALLRLIGDKTFSSISVSDVTSEANVSRMSFYRNYNAIEDIEQKKQRNLVQEMKRYSMIKNICYAASVFFICTENL